MLEQECRDAGVEIRCNIKVKTVEKNGQFTVHAEDASFARPAWWSRPEACPLPRSAPPHLVMIWPGNSD